MLWTSLSKPGCSSIILKPKKKKGFQFDEQDNKKKPNSTWAKMLTKVFKIDVTTCTCGGELTPVCAVGELDSIKRYLIHVGIDSDPPPRAPAASVRRYLAFEHHPDDELATIYLVD